MTPLQRHRRVALYLLVWTVALLGMAVAAYAADDSGADELYKLLLGGLGLTLVGWVFTLGYYAALFKGLRERTAIMESTMYGPPNQPNVKGLKGVVESLDQTVSCLPGELKALRRDLRKDMRLLARGEPPADDPDE